MPFRPGYDPEVLYLVPWPRIGPWRCYKCIYKSYITFVIDPPLMMAQKVHLKDADGSIAPAEGSRLWNAISPVSQLQNIALVKIDLSSCKLFIPRDRLLHSLHVLTTRHEHLDSWQTGFRVGLVLLSTSKPTEQGLQAEELKKRRQGPTLPDRLSISKDS